MKILVLQLTRPGDIFCSMPTLSALRRNHPDAEVHFLVRKRFAAAAAVAKYYDHLWQLDAQKLLGDFIIGDKNVTAGLTRLAEFIRELRLEKFDKIINLSFSPSSSFMAHLISEGGKIPVLGYSRTSDFYLSIADSPSRYFRAQCGLDKSNRVHVVDLLGEVAGVTMAPHDFHPLASINNRTREGVVCHLGASQEHKTWAPTSWVAFLSKATQVLGSPIILVGSSEDEALAQDVINQVGPEKFINKVGKTHWLELAEILKATKLFVGADSGPLHLANLCGTPSLNISVGDVRFWETGPTVTGSRVLFSRNPDHLMSDTVFTEFQEMLAATGSHSAAIICSNEALCRYSFSEYFKLPPDAWSLVQWMYFSGMRPHLSEELKLAVSQIEEVASIAVAQLDALEKKSERTEIVGILDRLDEVLEIIRKQITPLTPLLDEFRTAKENIPPGSRAEIFYQTRQCYSVLIERVNALSPRVQVYQQERETL